MNHMHSDELRYGDLDRSASSHVAEERASQRIWPHAGMGLGPASHPPFAAL